MAVKAMVFPGQGAQKVGMAKEFYDQYPQARAVFDQANHVLPFDVKAICFEGGSTLHQTQYTQPAILTAEMAIYAASIARGLDPHQVKYFAGHSLGEYAALVAAEVISLEIALQIVGRRAELMQAVKVEGGMAAVMMDELPIATLEEISQTYDIDIANYNSPQQVVISGQQPNLSSAVEALQTALGDTCRIVLLQVSAPFHSRHMREAQEAFAPYIASFAAEFQVAQAPSVLSNFTGDWHVADPLAIVDALTQQLSGKVRWLENMQRLVSLTDDITEIGPTRPLSGFFRTLDVNVQSICRLRQLDQWFARS